MQWYWDIGMMLVANLGLHVPIAATMQTTGECEGKHTLAP